VRTQTSFGWHAELFRIYSTGNIDLRGRTIFYNDFKVICPVQSRAQKYSSSCSPQITSKTDAILSH